MNCSLQGTTLVYFVKKNFKQGRLHSLCFIFHCLYVLCILI